MRVFVSTVPFAEENRLPREILRENGLEVDVNPFGKKITSAQLAEIIGNYDYLIAGTENISAEVLTRASNLRLISRVGIGLDGVDLVTARDMGIDVSYTPEAPAPAVAELTIGLMLSLLRKTHLASQQIKSGNWQRYFGRRIPEVTIGVIGVGRIGGRVLRRLSSFGTPTILVNDLSPDAKVAPELKLEWVEKDEIYSRADVITLHVPLTDRTHHMITARELALMKKDAILLNTARGGLIDEVDLVSALKAGALDGVALDVFENEPYEGPLTEFERCILTAHMGSMSKDCRAAMEITAARHVIQHLQGKPLDFPVPDYEYELKSRTYNG